MHMHTFNSPASAAAIVVFSNLFRVAWTGNNISVSKGALKFRCASKLCFANFSVKFWLKRWEIVVHGLTNMKNFPGVKNHVFIHQIPPDRNPTFFYW